MSTTPFSANLVTALKGYTHSGKLRAVQGPAVTPAFYCCISGNTVGVAKDPVPVFFVDNDVLCPNTPITVDYSLSWSPTDTIVVWDVDWGDGQISNGAWPGAGSVAHPLGGYVNPGKYTIILSLDDTLGAGSVGALQVMVLDCADEDAMDEGGDFPDERWGNFEHSRGMISGRNYVWRNDDIEGGAFGIWSKVETNQISTSIIMDIKITHDPTGLERFYVARWDGIYTYPIPPWYGEWEQLVSVPDLITAAGYNPALYDDVQKVTSLAFVEDKPGWGYCWWRANHNGPGFLGEDGLWGVAFTRNGWKSIAHSVVIDELVMTVGQNQDFADGAVTLVQESGGAIAFACGGIEDTVPAVDENYIYRTTDYGVTWTQMGTEPSMQTPQYCMVGNDWQGIVYWSTGGLTRRSTDQGGSWPPFTSIFGPLTVNPRDPRYMAIMNDLNIWEYIPNSGFHKFGATDWPAGAARYFATIRRLNDLALEDVLWIGTTGAAGVAYLLNADGTLDDITGVWAPAQQDYCRCARPETEEYLVDP